MVSFSCFEEVVYVGGVVLYFYVKTEVFIVSGQGVEAVGTGGDDLFDAVAFDGFDVFLGDGLVEVFVAELSGWFAAAFFFFAEDADFDAGCGADFDEAGGDLLVPSVKGGVAADEVEDVDVAVVCHDGDVEVLCPVGSGCVGEAEGVAVDFDVADGGSDFVAGEAPFHEGEVSSHFKDFVDMFVVGGADVLAGAAGGAGPEDVFADCFAQGRRGDGCGYFADLLDELHGGERFVGGVGGTAILASFAGHAGVGVEDVFPGEVGDFGGAELFDGFVFHVDGAYGPFGLEGGEEGVGAGGEDMAQFGEGDGGDEAKDECHVDPPEGFMAGAD